MPRLIDRLSPTAVMMCAAAIGMFLTASAMLLSINRPYLDLPEGAVPLSVGYITLTETDGLSEPDVLGTYGKMTNFFARQELIASELEAPQVLVTYRTIDGTTKTNSFTPRPRTIADLPFPFWFQQGVGILALLVAGWVIALRRNDWGARMFALTGLFVPIFAQAASVYSTRQIALPGDTFKLLSQINHFGAAAFGIALVGLFMMYPRPLFRPKFLLIPLVVFGVGIMLDLFYVGTDVWLNLIVLTQTLLALGFGIYQWWRSRRDPLNRAGLRWFFLFSMIGVSLFIGLSVLPPVLGISQEGLLPQAYAFGFFNFMHIGLALGVVRWRVFALDRYAYHVWVWLAGIALVFAVDLILLLWLREQPLEALTLALIIGGFLYFPLRQLLLSRLLGGKTPEVSHLIPEVIDAALSPTRQLQNARWDALLEQVFAPAAKIEPLPEGPSDARIAENGVALQVPALAGMSGRQMRYAAGGRRLFNAADVQAAAALTRMHAVASESHLAYERGVQVERDRISRDVHDNIGAQLLTALHTIEGSHKDALLRDTLTDLRQIISDGFHSDFQLVDVIADLRAEMADRLEVHAIKLDWPANLPTAMPTTMPKIMPGLADAQVPFLVTNTMRSVLREVTSNVIKHAKAQTVQVTLSTTEDRLMMVICDDGIGFDINAVTRGAGLDNMTERLKSVGGEISFARKEGKTCLTVDLPLNLSKAPQVTP